MVSYHGLKEVKSEPLGRPAQVAGGSLFPFVQFNLVTRDYECWCPIARSKVACVKASGPPQVLCRAYETL